MRQGYSCHTYRPDDDPAHRFFKRDGAGERRLVNLHVCEVGSAWEERHLLFHEYLRTNHEKATEYQLLKVRLSPEHDDVESYTEAKSKFIAKARASRAKKRALYIQPSTWHSDPGVERQMLRSAVVQSSDGKRSNQERRNG